MLSEFVINTKRTNNKILRNTTNLVYYTRVTQ